MTSGYYLISRADKIPFVKYKGDALRLINQTPWTFDEVVAGVKGKAGKLRKITTFRDSHGKIIERAFDYFDKPYRNRTYIHRDNIVNKNEYVQSTHIKEFFLSRANRATHLQLVRDGFARTLLWSPIKFFTNHMSTNIDNGKKILTKVIRSNLSKPKKEIHTFIEFPHIVNGQIRKGQNKFLQFGVNTYQNKITEGHTITKGGVKIPENDDFLAFRALDINDSKDRFAQMYINKRGLGSMDIKINPEYRAQDDVDEYAKAIFNPNDGSLNFRNSYVFESKSEVVATARHEVEHGWQFYLHSRNCGGTTPWEEKIYMEFGDIKNKKLKQEAQKYTDSIQSYVSLAEDVKQYRRNYVEVMANGAGYVEKEKYDAQRAEIHSQFPHIPLELL